jgi:hypothetical protein
LAILLGISVVLFFIIRPYKAKKCPASIGKALRRLKGFRGIVTILRPFILLRGSAALHSPTRLADLARDAKPLKQLIRLQGITSIVRPYNVLGGAVALQALLTYCNLPLHSVLTTKNSNYILNNRTYSTSKGTGKDRSQKGMNQ